jgi:RimJ/RimL family protein N-acetyltransferase
MRTVEPAELAALAGWLGAETPGPAAVLGHVASTGHGRAWADRWPAPAVVLVETGGNYLLVGAPAAVEPAALRPLVRGFLAAAADFDGVLDEAFPDRVRWDRVVYRLPAGAVAPAAPADAARVLRAADAPAVERLSDEIGWVAKTWGGPAGLATSGHAYGAFAGDRLAAVTCTFFQGARHADAGVVTEPELRGRGLGLASARAWCAGTVAGGRVPTWTTSTENTASRRIAERLGFELVRRDVLHVIGVEIPR